MTIDPDALLEGPRGRRLALAAALEAYDGHPDRWRIGMCVAQFGNERDVSSSRTMLTFTSLEADDADHPDPDRMTLPELARVLADAPVDRVPSLLPALSAAVDSARYWQEPDGEDTLAGLPELRPALLRIAGALVRHPDASTWEEPMESADQWQVVFDAGATPAPDLAAGVESDWAEWREEAVAAEFGAASDRPEGPAAPWSGSWWSTPVFGPSFATTRTMHSGPAGLRLVEDSEGWRRAVASPVRVDGASVYEVTGPHAWAGLCRRYPLTATASRRHDWYRATARAGAWLIPDWAAVARDYDGVHLTVAGYLRLAGRPIPVGEDAASVIAGWGPDQTWWLRRERVHVDHQHAVEWRLTDEGDWLAG
ncbi:hypothetical protein [Leifsonia sp. fls2-241-R2A-40a]|uniref:hypothetical protein n=1 Tax=Leifsonia sp. fls2-241-R2A-40a TaxID=3040290 RepID=UPI002549FFC0|nr:hypothetical protein [Leifsonia sp. fls2-241-R2A-40a]